MYTWQILQPIYYCHWDRWLDSWILPEKRSDHKPMHQRRRGGKSIFHNAETTFKRMARQNYDNRGRAFTMYFGFPRTIDTTKKLHCLSFNLQTVQSKFLHHQDVELEDIYKYVYIPNQVLLRLPNFIMPDPSFEIKNNHEWSEWVWKFLRVLKNSCIKYYGDERVRLSCYRGQHE